MESGAGILPDLGIRRWRLTLGCVVNPESVAVAETKNNVNILNNGLVFITRLSNFFHFSGHRATRVPVDARPIIHWLLLQFSVTRARWKATQVR